MMVVEDDTQLLNVIGKKMEVNKIKPLLYGSGAAAVKAVKEGKITPHAVWLDYYLTDMTGIEFLQALKKVKKYAKVPVVVVSNSASEENVHNVLALGARKYLLKAEYRMQNIIEMLIDLVKKNG